jgi:HEAT repeat protein
MRYATIAVLGTALLLTGLARGQDKKKDADLDARTLEQLIQRLKSKDRNESYAAAATLAKVGTRAQEAVATLEEMEKADPDPYRKSLATYVLTYVKPDAPASKATPQELLATLKTRTNAPAQRSLAAAHLARIGEDSGDAIYRDVVFLLKHDQDAYTRMLAAYVLPYLQPNNFDIPVMLAGALKDKNRETAKTAATSLVVLGRRANTATPHLVKMLDDKNPYTRALAAYVLGQIDPEKQLVLPALQKLIGDPNENVSKAAREALKKLQPENTSPARKT